MPQPTPDAIFGAHPNLPSPSVSQATHSPHSSPAVPLPSSRLAPALPALLLQSEQHPKLPHHTTTHHPRLTLKPLHVALLPPDSCALPRMLRRALEDLVSLGKWKARFSSESSFLPP
ncbi:uncharacterized protein LACBIDRAFT_304833 [Laccaria bicolor S238N-H82]|uniref:Predicted protein n=1 Tax=Laccaria bicolor (strain S238N-H82 / ATCC MYA-4686) TaxID=486041 RepID=B0D2B7_LACBS|nr:uncharacterized protein LACBIDRAFT_315410 [Laccaria bicolor S238N-H82]XP_001885072.1 uncharacterized protein LACBIDRAFT_304833 [Laccaria bicolor S238N-H82]EDR04181.1 predicted protein [Laccaria bicolor S238N-H82]EDR10716.1 predicted protein [Laccaria bicolor S238N-H82]|eukprot:XP_001878017.1 predicted protein [Laccaria bicolor S238N-H82]